MAIVPLLVLPRVETTLSCTRYRTSLIRFSFGSYLLAHHFSSKYNSPMHFFRSITACILAAALASAGVVAPKLGRFESWVDESSIGNRLDASSRRVTVKPEAPPGPLQQSAHDDMTDPTAPRLNATFGPDPIKQKACATYTSQTITIPVYVRIYYYQATPEEAAAVRPGYYGYHSVEDVKKAIAKMNADFAKWNPRIRYVLASGTTRYTAGVWYYRFATKAGFTNQQLNKGDQVAEMAIANECRMPLAQRPASQTRQLWIYSVNYIANGAAAFSYRPVSTSPFTQDGIFIQTDYFQQSSAYPSYYAPSILTHEVGHWLGLYHIFDNNSCGQPNSATVGDMCRLTPQWATTGAPLSCPVYGTSFASQRNPCNPRANADEIQRGVTNFMAYSYELCRTTFQADQHGLMWRTAVNFRKFVPTCGISA